MKDDDKVLEFKRPEKPVVLERTDLIPYEIRSLIEEYIGINGTLTALGLLDLLHAELMHIEFKDILDGEDNAKT